MVEEPDVVPEEDNLPEQLAEYRNILADFCFASPLWPEGLVATAIHLAATSLTNMPLVLLRFQSAGSFEGCAEPR